MKNIIIGHEDKVVSAVKDNIQMSVVNGKLCAINLVTFTLNDEEKEVSGFFEDINSANDTIECIMPLSLNGNVLNEKIDTWLTNDKSTFNIEKYPEEMQPAISKSINQNKGILKDTKKIIVYFKSVKDLSFFNKNIQILEKANIALMNDIKKYKQAGMQDNIEEFIDRYMFKKHVLIQGEKGGKLAS